MADGAFSARARLVADTPTALFTVPADTAATANINLTNHGSEVAVVKVAITSGGVPADSDWIEAGVSLQTGQTFLRTQEPMIAAEVVYVAADKATVDVRVSGFQEDV